MEGIFNTVPSVLLAGIAASIIALLGVFISSYWNAGSVKRQMAHDAAERRRERIDTLKAGVYLEALNKISQAEECAYRFAYTHVDEEKIRYAFLELGLVSDKLRLVSREETCQIFDGWVGAYGDNLVKFFQGESKEGVPDFAEFLGALNALNSKYKKGFLRELKRELEVGV